MECKKLIIYYSYTGHTKMIVDMIKEKVDCDVLLIEPLLQYSNNYQFVVDKTEKPTEEQYITPSLKNIEVDLSKYDTIILGTPVWWYKIAPPIRTFLKENKLDGKRVIPFATNAGWLGDTFKEIRELCPNCNIENELSIKFSVDYKANKILTFQSDIDDWINKIIK